MNYQQSLYEKLLKPITKLPEKPSKAIAIIYTGGTIGMVKDAQGQLSPDPNYLLSVLQTNPIFIHKDMPSYMLYSLPPPIDSSIMTPEDWRKIALSVLEIYEIFKGFVIVHGTDTLAYTASALSFMFENLQKHVVLTASQLPLSSPYSDGYFNLAGSIICASQLQIPEVTVFINNKLMRGNRSQKFSSWSLDAFDSTQMQPLAEFGITLNYRRDLVRNFQEPDYGAGDFKVADICDSIGVIHLVPGLEPQVLENYQSCKGIILQVFGEGNGGSDQFCEKLGELHKAGCVIGLVSQAHTSEIKLGSYNASSQLKKAGAKSSQGMTSEAAYAKLSYLLGKNLTQRDVEDAFTMQNIRGERD
ncbi:L-asparaginase [Spironucleus salmonicida]|uniref:asparaginase n=1 Tax=Spironucleus salmonicida TaxID=348837 RepID=V6LYD0_9EUKA|nr:L-asparaginase [Spironucleus salmonicida]|eukprot:EST48711.1 L-asparaginase [Spironucleus salmonicida]